LGPFSLSLSSTCTLLSVYHILYPDIPTPTPRTNWTSYTPFYQWHNLYSTSILFRITSGVRSSPLTVSPPSHHLLTSITESGDVYQPIPGAMSDLSGPFLDCDDDPESDLIDLWSWLPTSALRLVRVSLLFSRSLQRVPLVDPTAVSISTAACAMAFQRQRPRILHNPRPRCGLPHPHFTSI